jgi:hypothetical protein
VVAPRAVIPKRLLSQKLWTWLEPFDWMLWLVLLGSVLIGGVLFYFLEDGSRVENDFSAWRDEDAHSNPRAAAFGHSVFLAALSVTTIGDHSPTTFPARIYTVCKTFSLWIGATMLAHTSVLHCAARMLTHRATPRADPSLPMRGEVMAAYLANFAAGLATKPKAYQPVTGFSSFTTLGQPMCVRNNAVHLQFMAAVYPDVPLHIVGPGTTDVLDAVLNGTCIGGMGSDLELRWALGAGDVTGKYCPLVYAGDPSLATFQFAIPFTLNRTQLPDETLNAVNQAVDVNILSGNFSTQAAQVFIPRDRPPLLCAKYLASFETDEPTSDRVPPLTVSDMAGIFILQAVGIVVALLYHIFKLAQRRVKRVRRESKRMSEAAAMVSLKEEVHAFKFMSEEEGATHDGAVGAVEQHGVILCGTALAVHSAHA